MKNAQLAGIGGIVINGVAITDPSALQVFPGTYEMSLPNSYFMLNNTNTVQLSDPEEARALEKFGAELTERARNDFRAAITAALNECIASKEILSPCGIDLPKRFQGGESPVEGTITRTLTEDPTQTLQQLMPITRDQHKRLVLSTDKIFKANITGTFTKDGEVFEGEILWDQFGIAGDNFGDSDMFSTAQPFVDLSTVPATVTWGK